MIGFKVFFGSLGLVACFPFSCYLFCHSSTNDWINMSQVCVWASFISTVFDFVLMIEAYEFTPGCIDASYNFLASGYVILFFTFSLIISFSFSQTSH